MTSRAPRRRDLFSVLLRVTALTGLFNVRASQASDIRLTEPGPSTLTELLATRFRLSPDRDYTCLGFERPRDGGMATYRVEEQGPDGWPLVTSAGQFVYSASGIYSPEMFWCGVHHGECTAAVQSAVTCAALSSSIARFAPRSYYIDGPIVIPSNVRRFRIEGVGAAEIVQIQSNAPCIWFSGVNTSYWCISGLGFRWKREVDVDHLRSVGVYFHAGRSSSAGHWNFLIQNCLFDNGRLGIGVFPHDVRQVCPVWGAVIERCATRERHRGPLISLSTQGRAGQPHITLTDCYIRGDKITGGALLLHDCDTVYVRGLEVNFGDDAYIAFENCRNVMVESCRFERVRSNGGRSFIRVSGRGLIAGIRGIVFQNCFVDNDKDVALIAVEHSNVSVDFVTAIGSVLSRVNIGAKLVSLRGDAVVEIGRKVKVDFDIRDGYVR